MQAMKMFQGGQGGQGGGGGQSQMISMAMQEASKLFDSQASQGNVAGKSKSNDVVFVLTISRWHRQAISDQPSW